MPKKSRQPKNLGFSGSDTKPRASRTGPRLLATREQLAAMSITRWETWLADETAAWLAEDKAAYAPLYISRLDPDPGGRLAYEVELSCGGRTSAPARAACQLIARSSLQLGDPHLVGHIVRFAVALQAPALFSAIRFMLRGRPQLSDMAKSVVCTALVGAARDMFTNEESRQLAKLLDAQKLLAPNLAAILLATITTDAPGDAANTIVEHAPGFADADDDSYLTFVAVLLRSYSPYDLRTAWSRTRESVVPAGHERLFKRLGRALDYYAPFTRNQTPEFMALCAEAGVANDDDAEGDAQEFGN